jgi:hypothetical protein
VTAADFPLIGKGIHRTIRASRVETLTVFPDIQIVGAR